MAASQALRQVFKSFQKLPGFDRNLGCIELVSTSEGKISCKIPVEERHLNIRGFLHGGYVASLVDTLTTMTLFTCKNSPTSVSVDLNVSYLASAKLGDTLSVNTEVLKLGKTLGYASVTIENQHGSILATGRHTMFLK